MKNVDSRKQLLNPVVVDEVVRRWLTKLCEIQFLNPVAVDGIVRNVDSSKQLLNPVVVDEVCEM